MAKKLKLWLPAIAWMGVIFAFSSMPINHGKEFSWIDFIFKKTAHVTEYAILYFLVWRASSKAFAVSLILCIIYSLTDEWHQTFTPGREGTLRDVGFDSLGALIMLIWLKIKS